MYLGPEFWKDILDKLLIGLIVVGATWGVNYAMERHKATLNYWQALSERVLQAYMDCSALVAGFALHIRSIHEGLVAWNAQQTTENREALSQLITSFKFEEIKLRQYCILFSPPIIDALLSCMNEAMGFINLMESELPGNEATDRIKAQSEQIDKHLGNLLSLMAIEIRKPPLLMPRTKFFRTKGVHIETK